MELRVLIVEDVEDDATLTVRRLEQSGYAVTSRRVVDAPSMRAALAEAAWDVVLSDWALPQFSGTDALRVLHESGLDIPFIIVSGAIRDEVAVEAMLAGAHDFVIKDRLTRLPAAVGRERKGHWERAGRRRAEAALARTEKLRALGQMAAGVTHDLKNILNPMSFQLQLAGRALDRGAYAQATESVEEMKHLLARGVQTLERLQSYSRQTPEVRTDEVDLDRLIHEACEIAKPRAASRAGPMPRFRKELGAPKRFPGTSGDIVSALVNLIVNAIDAVERGGTITLRTGNSEGYVWAQVRDDGPGMPPDVEQRAFEPFFTTKGDDGTGLGLAMVFACMQRHGGAVTLATAPGEGTTFTLSFPAPDR